MGKISVPQMGGGKLVFKELGVFEHSWGDATSVSFVLTQDMLPGANLDKLTDENFFMKFIQTLGSNWSGYQWDTNGKGHQATYDATTHTVTYYFNKANSGTASLWGSYMCVYVK